MAVRELRLMEALGSALIGCLAIVALTGGAISFLLEVFYAAVSS